MHLAFSLEHIHTEASIHSGGATNHNLSWILMSEDCSIQKAPGGSKVITLWWLTPKHIIISSLVCVCMWWWLPASSCCTSLFLKSHYTTSQVQLCDLLSVSSVELVFAICFSILCLPAASVTAHFIWYDLMWTQLHPTRLKDVCRVGVHFIPSLFIHLSGGSCTFNLFLTHVRMMSF